MPLPRRLAPMAVAALLPLVNAGCEKSYSRSEMNPRKESIYRYASALCEQDLNAQVQVSGIGAAPTDHPARLKAPYPTRADLEGALGKADHEEVRRESYLVPGGLGKEAEENDLALTWWERDTDWTAYGKNGLEKPGHREILTAWFDPGGHLKKIFVVHPVGSEFVGRSSWDWKWAQGS